MTGRENQTTLWDESARGSTTITLQEATSQPDLALQISFCLPAQLNDAIVSAVRQARWTFVRHEGVGPTNNAAERTIRPGLLWRKGSFGAQSADGFRFVEAMMTVVATLKQQPNVLDYLTAACQAALCGEAAPSSHASGTRTALAPHCITRW
jgi:hypothetical protein